MRHSDLELDLAEYMRSLPRPGRGKMRVRPKVRLDPSQVEDRREDPLVLGVAAAQAKSKKKKWWQL